MVTFCLIGGKMNKEVLSNKIENHLLELTNKKRPKLLYFPFAAKNYKKSNDRFKLLINSLDVDVYYMNLDDINNFDNLLSDTDILYIGGGVSDDLIDLFKEKGLDKILYKYLDTNKIYAGSSAGAMLYCKACMGDKYMYSDNFHNYNYKMVDGLGILDLGICPHYQNEDLIIYNDEVKNYNYDSFGIEEDSAVIIKDNHFYILKEEKNISVYYFSKNDYIMRDLKEGVIYEKDGGFRS
ncbi:MAG: Type 1 glutamine amidotransferase-like domain-containing protein [Acholeplasmatales bacterium]|nr:Type 1 glutamine amidotransferase-like domain-containing protein [Acholeplasmatales bacterium]